MTSNGSERDAAFQDLIPDNRCFGCGPLNPAGLQIKSRWAGDESVGEYTPLPHHMAGPAEILNGGIIATVIDCTLSSDGAVRAEAEVVAVQVPAEWRHGGRQP